MKKNRGFLEKLSADEVLYFNQFTIDRITDAIYWTAEDGQFIYVNRATCVLLKLSKEEFLGLSITDIANSEHAKNWPLYWEELKEKGTVNFESNLWTKSGSYIPVEIHDEFMSFNGREFCCSMVRDISDKRKANELLLNCEARFRSFFNLPLIGIAITSPKKEWVEVNDELCKMLGYTKKELAGLSWLELTHLDDQEKNIELFDRLASGQIEGFTIQKRFICKDGSYIWVDLSVGCVRKPDRSLDFLVTMVQNITERKNAVEALEKSEEKFFKAFKTSPIVIFITSLSNGTIIDVNDSIFQITQYSAAELIGKSSIDMRLWYSEAHRNQFVEHLAKEGRVSNMESIFRKKSGETFIGLISGEFIELQGQKCVLSMVHDISERIKSEELIRKSEAQYRLLAKNMIDVIWTMDREGRLNYVSPSVEKLLGYTEQEMLMQTPEIGMTPLSWKIVQDRIEAAMPNIIKGIEYAVIDPKPIALEQKRKNGTTVWTETIIKPLYDNENCFNGFMGVTRDISERKKSEQEILENQIQLRELNSTKDKFFSIIAHDLKSPFNSIIGFSNLLIRQIQENDFDGIDQIAGFIKESAEKTMILLTDLLEWARSQSGRIEFIPEQLDVVSLIDEIVKLLSNCAHQKAIKINRNLPSSMVISADKAMIGTMIRNLLSNAVKFTNEEGEITISLEQNPDHLIFSIQDNGVGIRQEDIDKLFRIDTSFSTQGTSNEQGSGLGLILCKEFIEKHKGKIWANSQMQNESDQHGSVFCFSLPFNEETLN